MSDPTNIAIGGGPAGLSAALFSAKNGFETVVFDTDEPWLHKAYLFNYLGIERVASTAFLETARTQADEFVAERKQSELVTNVEHGANSFTVTTDEDVVDVDVTMETSVADAYTTGTMVHAEEWEAVISAGDTE